jgi:hypothetical protein
MIQVVILDIKDFIITHKDFDANDAVGVAAYVKKTLEKSTDYKIKIRKWKD